MRIRKNYVILVDSGEFIPKFLCYILMNLGGERL